MQPQLPQPHASAESVGSKGTYAYARSRDRPGSDSDGIQDGRDVLGFTLNIHGYSSVEVNPSVSLMTASWSDEASDQSECDTADIPIPVHSEPAPAPWPARPTPASARGPAIAVATPPIPAGSSCEHKALGHRPPFTITRDAPRCPSPAAAAGVEPEPILYKPEQRYKNNARHRENPSVRIYRLLSIAIGAGDEDRVCVLMGGLGMY